MIWLFDDLNLDRSVVDGLLADRVALLPGFELCFLNGVHLQEAIHLNLIAQWPS